MSKAVKAVTKAVSGVGSSLFGGGGSPGAFGTGRFQAGMRPIDKKAFKIEGSEEASKRAKERETESLERSKKAQEDRQTLISQLQGQAAGTAPSLAEAQLKSASDRSLAQQLAAAQSQRGGSAALRERQLMRGQAQAGRELAQDASTARLQERQMAQQLLGQQIGQEQQLADQLVQNYLQQGFSIELARQKAQADYEAMMTGQYQAASQLNAAGFEGAAGRRMGFTTELMGNASSMLAGFSDKKAKKKIKKASKKDMGKALAMSSDDTKTEKKKATGFELAKGVKEQLDKTLKSGDKALGKEEKKEEKKKKKKGKTELGEAGEKAAAKGSEGFHSIRKDSFESLRDRFSDKDSKKDMKAYSDKNIKKDFLDKLEAYTYEYKDKFKDDPRAGHGRHMSVMAQDLEKAGPIGKQMVKETEEGVKMVDYAKGYGAILAAQAHLNKRLDELEKKKSKKRK